MRSNQMHETLLPKRLALPVYCSDPISSNAYATQEILLVLALGGASYAHYQSYISPDLFKPLISIYIFLALMIGGVGNNYGAVAGPLLLLFILEGSRFVIQAIPGITVVQAASFREILIGVVLIAVTRFAPQGLLKERKPTF